MSRWASSKTGTGKTAGPALKLKILSVMMSPEQYLPQIFADKTQIRNILALSSDLRSSAESVAHLILDKAMK
jgi:hypothetical protein